MDADALRAELGQAKVVARSLRNHARTVAAYLTDLEERLDVILAESNPPAVGGPGNGHKSIEQDRLAERR